MAQPAGVAASDSQHPGSARQTSPLTDEADDLKAVEVSVSRQTDSPGSLEPHRGPLSCEALGGHGPFRAERSPGVRPGPRDGSGGSEGRAGRSQGQPQSWLRGGRRS